MAAILFLKISQKIFKSKYYKLIVHCKIESEIETLLQKKVYVGHGNAYKRGTTNQSRATKFGRWLPLILMKLYWKFDKSI